MAACSLCTRQRTIITFCRCWFSLSVLCKAGNFDLIIYFLILYFVTFFFYNNFFIVGYEIIEVTI